MQLVDRTKADLHERPSTNLDRSKSIIKLQIMYPTGLIVYPYAIKTTKANNRCFPRVPILIISSIRANLVFRDLKKRINERTTRIRLKVKGKKPAPGADSVPGERRYPWTRQIRPMIRKNTPPIKSLFLSICLSTLMHRNFGSACLQ